MNLGQRIVALTSANPFAGAGMSLVTALVALAILVVLRRMLPPLNRLRTKTGRCAQNCAMNCQASGGMKALRPSSPVLVPSSTLDGVCPPSNVHILTG